MLVIVDRMKLRKCRIEAGLSMHRLSIQSGLGKNAISKIENGECEKSSLLRLEAIERALNLPPKSLVKEQE